MDLTRISAHDLAALLGAADSQTTSKAEQNEAFAKAADEILTATNEAVAALHRLEQAERTMGLMVRQFFTKQQIIAAKWDER